MEIYVVDTCAIRELLFHFNRSIPVFEIMWTKLEKMIVERKVVFVKETFKELEKQVAKNGEQYEWLKKFKGYFEPPTNEECKIVANIYSYRNFQNNISQKNLLNGRPVADAFIVAKAKYIGSNAKVVSREVKTENAAKIPNICEVFNVTYLNDEFFQKMLLT